MSPIPSTTTAPVPFFDVTDPSFSITSAQVHAAREQSWYATTPYGIAVLRYEQMNKLLKSRQLRQGSVAWPLHGDQAAWAWSVVALALTMSADRKSTRLNSSH